MDKRFISLRDVLSRVPISKTHLYRLINSGEFPKPIRISQQRVAFLESEIEEWMNARLEARSHD